LSKVRGTGKEVRFLAGLCYETSGFSTRSGDFIALNPLTKNENRCEGEP